LQLRDREAPLARWKEDELGKRPINELVGRRRGDFTTLHERVTTRKTESEVQTYQRIDRAKVAA